MNIITVIMLVFFGLGCVDNIFGNRWKIGNGFSQGISQMGGLMFSIIGIYAIGVTAIRNNIDMLAVFCDRLPFDASVLMAMVVAPDLGGIPLSMEVAASGRLANFSGVLVAGGLGCLLSFQLPIMLGMIEKKDMDVMMQGVIYGVTAIPVGLFVGGIMLGLTRGELILNILPVLSVCIILAVGAWKVPAGMTKILFVLGTMIRGMAILLSIIVILDLFVGSVQIVPDTLIAESIQLSVKVVVIVSGGMVFSECFLRIFTRQVQCFAQKIGVNSYSVMGLILSFSSAAAMLPLVKNMDKKGKMMNAAFSVMGAYVIGGQMAFAAEMTGSYVLLVCNCLGPLIRSR